MKKIRNDLAKLLLLAAFLSVGIAAQKTADNHVILANFERSIDLGKLSEVERDLFGYVIANPADAKGFSLLAKLRLKQGRVGEARSVANKALSLDPGLLKAKLTLAHCAFQLGDADELRGVLSRFAENDLSDSAIRLEVARLYTRIGDCSTATRLADRLPIKIKKADALPLRANCYLQAGNKKELVLLMPLARIQARQNPAIAVEFAEMLFSGGFYKESIEITNRVIAGSPNNFDGLFLLAKSEISLGILTAAKIHLTRAEKIRPDSAELFFTRSLLETGEGKHQAAYESLERSLTLNSNNAGTLAQYVIAALRVGQAGRAVKAAEKLLVLKPENPEYSYLYGIAALQTDNLQKAEEALSKYVESRPDDPRGCLALGLAYSAQNNKMSAARRQLQKCLTIDPKTFEAAFQLGLSYKTEGDFAKAAEYFEQTVRLSPDYTAALRELGTVYLQTGAEAKARPLLEKAVRLSPADAETHFQLSRLYNILGESELGKKHLEIFQKLRNPKKEGM